MPNQPGTAPSRPASSRPMAVLSALCLACWTLLSVVIGGWGVWHALHESELIHVVRPGREFEMTSGDVAGAVLGLLWFLSQFAMVVPTILGTVDIAVAYRVWWRPVAFAALGVIAPVAEVRINAAYGAEPPRSLTSLAHHDLASSTGVIAVAVLTMALASLLLGLGRRPRR